jgi:hypothetical protein
MREIFICLFLFLSTGIFSQEKKKSRNIVSTIGIFDTLETKSGYQINKYYVELTSDQVKEFKRKKVKVTGKLLIIKGIDLKDPVIVQGAVGDRYFILEPKIKVVK